MTDNAEERPEDTVRRYAEELVRLGDGLRERGMPPWGWSAHTSPVDDALATIDQLAYERRILGRARRLFDQVAEDKSVDRSLRDGAARIANAIVDEIGHPVTDEPALGQSHPEQLVDVREWLEACPLRTGWRP